MTFETTQRGRAPALLIIALAAVGAQAQTAGDPQTAMRSTITVNPPDAQCLSGRSAVVRYRTENLRIAPVFGAAALAVSPRVGHVHVSVDQLPWVWAHTSEEPVIVSGLAPGEHNVRLQLVNANHRPLHDGAVKFTVPEAEKRATAAAGAQDVEHQPAARIIVEAPLVEPLARGVVFIRYRAENLDIVPLFGSAAAAVSPRVGHAHIAVDDNNWYWVDASRNPVIVQGLSPGAHKIRIRLANADHQVIDHQTVEVTIPEPRKSSEQHHDRTHN